MKNKYNQLRNEITKVCPDILDLTFGCQILRYKDKPDERKYKVIEDIGYACNDKIVWINSVPFGSMQMPIEILKSKIGDKTGDWVVVGRDITLSDVLRLFVHLSMPDLSLSVSGINPNKAVAELTLTRIAKLKLKKRIIMWKLYQDNLADQSDDTINFLYDLIYKQSA